MSSNKVKKLLHKILWKFKKIKNNNQTKHYTWMIRLNKIKEVMQIAVKMMKCCQ